MLRTRARCSDLGQWSVLPAFSSARIRHRATRFSSHCKAKVRTSAVVAVGLQDLPGGLLVEVVPERVIAKHEAGRTRRDAAAESLAVGVGRHAVTLFEHLREMELA